LKRFLLSLALLVASFGIAAAQEESKAPSGNQAAAEEKPMLGWMWANFVILAIGLGYLGAKKLPPLLRARSEEIRRGIDEAAKLKAESDARLAEIERRFSGIASDIDQLRIELIAEMNQEGQRLRSETERLASRIHQQAEQEIEFMIKASRLELKAYSAQLAIDLAVYRIKDRMTPEKQHRLVDAFLADLGSNGKRSVQ
jgi:F-type H+-transporting ATPase subunit b